MVGTRSFISFLSLFLFYLATPQTKWNKENPRSIFNLPFIVLGPAFLFLIQCSFQIKYFIFTNVHVSPMGYLTHTHRVPLQPLHSFAHLFFIYLSPNQPLSKEGFPLSDPISPPSLKPSLSCHSSLTPKPGQGYAQYDKKGQVPQWDRQGGPSKVSKQ